MGVLVGGVAIVVVYQALMNAFPRMYFMLAFLVALYTGLRPMRFSTEAFGLRLMTSQDSSWAK